MTETTQEARAFELWFFRDISDEQRCSLIALTLGRAIADEAKNHSQQRTCLRRIMPALTTAQSQAAALAAENEALREAGDVLNRRLAGFVYALAEMTDCGPDVDAMNEWKRARGGRVSWGESDGL